MSHKKEVFHLEYLAKARQAQLSPDVKLCAGLWGTLVARCTKALPSLAGRQMVLKLNHTSCETVEDTLR